MKANLFEIIAKYDNSHIFTRWVGALLDFGILFIVGICIRILIPESILPKTTSLAYIIFAFLVYFPVMEHKFGFTLGKRIVGLYVIDINFNKPSFLQAFVRAVLRIFEVNPLLLGGIPAGLVCLISNNKQRLGDMFAQTYVIEKHDYKKALAAINNNDTN